MIILNNTFDVISVMSLVSLVMEIFFFFDSVIFSICIVESYERFMWPVSLLRKICKNRLADSYPSILVKFTIFYQKQIFFRRV